MSADPGIRRLATRGALVTGLGFGAARVLRLVSQIVLAWLLLPEHFGLMALVASVTQGLQMFSDLGLGPCIVRDERGEEPRFLDTAWTIQVLRGLALWVLTCILAVPFASFYGEPELAWILPVSGASAAIGGWASTRLFLAQKRFELGRVVLVELGEHLSAILTMLVWAAIDPAVWSLVAGGVVGALVKVVGSHVLLPGPRHRLTWDPEVRGRIVAMARWILLSTILTWCAGQSDRLIFGKLIPLSLLGVYDRALKLALVPAEIVQRVTSRVLLPWLSRPEAKADGVFQRARKPVLVVAGASFSMLVAAGPATVELLFKPVFVPAGWMLQILAVGLWVVVIDEQYVQALLAAGRPRYLTLGNAVRLVAMIGFVVLGHTVGQFPGALIGFAASALPKYAVSLAGLRMPGIWVVDLAYTGVLVLASGAGLAFAWLAGDSPPAVRMVLAVCGAGAVWGPELVSLVRQLRGSSVLPGTLPR